MELSKEYLEALAVSRQASDEYHEVAAKYRNLEIGDREFLAARAKHVKALHDFDAAFVKERTRAETVNPEIIEDN
jgi:phage head maturation protease